MEIPLTFTKESFENYLREAKIIDPRWKRKTQNMEAYRKEYKEKCKEIREQIAEPLKDAKREVERHRKAQYAETMRLRKRVLKEFMVKYKGNMCRQCGLQHSNPTIYDFHHRDPTTKSFEIGDYQKTYPHVILKEELDKCDLLCAICHRDLENPT